MTERRTTTPKLNQTAALLLVAYLDVAILGGVALIAHWTGEPDQRESRQTAEDCSGVKLTASKGMFDKSVRIPEAIGSEESDLSDCYKDLAQSRR